jgi:hypothetical protein
MATRMQQRRGTASQWTTANPILAAGEIGFESDTGQFKIGDGTNYWADLSYFKNIDDLGGNLDDYVPISLLAQPEGVATLDVNGQVPSDQLGNAVTSLSGYATETYVNDAIAGVVDGAPALLDTLNEIATAIADDENYAVSTVNYINQQVDDLEVAIGNAITTAETTTNTAIDTFEQNVIVPIQSDVTTLQSNVLNLDGSKQDKIDGVSDVEIGYLANVTSDIQTQINAKADGSHTHTVGEITGITVSAEEINSLVGITDDVQVLLDGKAGVIHTHSLSDITDVTATVAEVNVLDGITATTAELNILTGATVTALELDTLSGATSNIQNQLDDKAAATHVHSLVDVTDVTATTTEVNYLSGVTSGLQSQLDDKAAASHSHAVSDLTGVTVDATAINSLSGVQGNVQSQLDGKADDPHTHFLQNITDVSATASEVNYLSGVTSGIQGQLDAISGDVSDISDALVTKQDKVAGITDTEIGYLDGVTSLIQQQLDGKSAIGHTHGISDVSGVTATTTEINHLVGVSSAIQDQLDDKAAATHTHPQSDITDLVADLASKADLAGATFSGSVEVPSMTVTGNLVVQGTTTTVDTTNYSIRDNMLYMNQAGVFAISDAIGNGATVTYTAQDHDFQAGDYIVVTGVNPSGYNIAGTDLLTIDSVTNNTFTVTKSDTGTYVSGGSARGKSAANPDLGFAAGRTTAEGYAHAGLFRDASDATFKFFDGYTPEPDESLYIDTAHASFALAPIEVAAVTTGDLDVSGAVSGISTSDLDDVTLSFASDKDVLVHDGSGWVNKYVNAIPTKISQGSVVSNNYELVAADAGKIVEISNANATTVTIPSDETFAVGSMIVVSQTGAGQVTVVVEDSGIQTLNSTPGSKLRAQWSVATLLKRSANTWLVYGDLVA